MGYPNDPYQQGWPHHGQNQPQYGQDQYGQPHYAQPPYGQPQYGSGQYSQAQPYDDALPYPVAGYGPYGGYPPPRRSRGPIYAAVAIVAVVLVGAAIGIPLIMASSEKAPPTASASRLILDEDDFTAYGGEFSSINDEGMSFRVDATPSECDFLVAPERPSDVEYAWALWEDDDGRSASLFVEMWADDKLATQEDVIDDACSSFSFVESDLGYDEEPTDVDVEIVPVDGAPSTTVSTEQVRRRDGGDKRTFRVLETVVRGTTIRLGFGTDGSWSDADESDAVELFNKQITKIREAE